MSSLRVAGPLIDTLFTHPEPSGHYRARCFGVQVTEQVILRVVFDHGLGLTSEQYIRLREFHPGRDKDPALLYAYLAELMTRHPFLLMSGLDFEPDNVWSARVDQYHGEGSYCYDLAHHLVLEGWGVEVFGGEEP